MMHRRREFSAAVKREAYDRADGICECHRIPWLKRPHGCGARLGPANTFYEHINPDNIKSDPTLANCAVLVRTCWREKTDTYDRPVIAKANHVRDMARNIKQNFYRPIVGSKRSGIALPFRGPPVDRATRQPWRPFR